MRHEATRGDTTQRCHVRAIHQSISSSSSIPPLPALHWVTGSAFCCRKSVALAYCQKNFMKIEKCKLWEQAPTPAPSTYPSLWRAQGNWNIFWHIFIVEIVKELRAGRGQRGVWATCLRLQHLAQFSSSIIDSSYRYAIRYILYIPYIYYIYRGYAYVLPPIDKEIWAEREAGHGEPWGNWKELSVDMEKMCRQANCGCQQLRGREVAAKLKKYAPYGKSI